MRSPHRLFLQAFIVGSAMSCCCAMAGDKGTDGKFYRVVDGKVDARTFNGFRRYHGSCNHCHGPDGVGSTIASPLVDRLPGFERFQSIVRDGTTVGASVMKGFARDANIEPYIQDIYAYLEARADGAIGRGRPARLEP
jgi:mono/diheme cytochrome c family protein